MRPNILSGNKLRKQFDALWVQMNGIKSKEPEYEEVTHDR